MKYTKLINSLIAFAIIVAMCFTTGCSCDGYSHNDWEAPTFGSGKDTVSTEAPSDTSEPKTEIKLYHEDGLTDFEFGDEIWTVEVDKLSTSVYLLHYSVVGQKGEIVEAVPYWSSNVDYIRKVLSYGTTTIYPFFINQIYREQYDAMVAVATLNGETFEEYWGPLIITD